MMKTFNEIAELKQSQHTKALQSTESSYNYNNGTTHCHSSYLYLHKWIVFLRFQLDL